MYKHKSFWLLLPLIVAFSVVGGPLPAVAQDLDDLPVGTVRNFGPNLQTIANGICRQPEGIAIDADGNLYAASNSDAATTVGYICVINDRGQLIDTIPVPAGPGATAVGLLGELFVGDSLYVLDQADDVQPHGRILKVNPHTHDVETVASGLAFPNGMAMDRHGNLYVADSFLGAIYKLSKETGKLALWFTDPALLSNNPNQPVGANDLAFDADQHFLYVTNAGNRQVLRVAFNDGKAGKLELFADGATIDAEQHLPSPTALYFADGLQFDVKGNLYVMANIANEIDLFSPEGKLVHRYRGTGDNAFDFNASLVFKGRLVFITNMSATDGGINSKLSVFVAPHRGLLSDGVFPVVAAEED
jgi:sugar lactone lactonase YvrE